MGRRPLDMDVVVRDLVLTDDHDAKRKIGKKIVSLGYKNGVYPASIHELYMAMGRGDVKGFTVPAMNLRTMTYDLAKAIFRAAKKINAGAFIFEIAKSEMGYTDQSPVEYVGVIVAAAIKEGYQGPVFIQADHVQINLKKFREDRDKEIASIKEIITEAIDAGFYNIDIDSSTVVDLSRRTINKQQELNYTLCGKLAQFIRKIQPKGIEVSVGGEIGEVGSKNSTPEELRAFMDGFRASLRKGKTGLSKLSIQTGTSHGGVVLPDGSIAQVKLDFETLRSLSKIAREEYGLAGAVQHGASTLPQEAFGKFPEAGTAEVHLATQFQNMILDSAHFPHDLRDRMYRWLEETQSAEKKPDMTSEQFIYKTRKKVLGPFKKDIMNIPPQERAQITAELEQLFDFLFTKLNVKNTKPLVDKHITQKRVISRKPLSERGSIMKQEGLAEGDD